MLDEPAVTAYLDRIGLQRPAVLDEAALRALHRAHLMTVPFENLSIHLDEPISLTEGDLVSKIVTRRRGGFCYELNGAFALLLEALGAAWQAGRRAGSRRWAAGAAFRPSCPGGAPARRRPGWPTWSSAATARTRCALTSGRSKTIRPAGSRWPMPKPATWTWPGTGSRSTGSSAGAPPGGLRPDLLVAADLPGVPFHPEHDLLAPLNAGAVSDEAAADDMDADFEPFQRFGVD